jgi:hypothetical protein
MDAKRPRRIRVDQDPEKPLERGVLAKAIVDISKAARELARSGLNKKAITLLVAHKARCGQSTAAAVLEALEQLEQEYVR